MPGSAEASSQKFHKPSLLRRDGAAGPSLRHQEQKPETPVRLMPSVRRQLCGGGCFETKST
jgi:hypothetical protein